MNPALILAIGQGAVKTIMWVQDLIASSKEISEEKKAEMIAQLINETDATRARSRAKYDEIKARMAGGQ